MLLMAGLHTPVMPLSEVVGKAAITAPSQNGPTGVKVGTVGALIVSVSVAVVAQLAPEGVKVNVEVPAEAVEKAAGFQVPLIPSFDGFGGVGGISPTQTAAGVGKVGVTLAVTVIAIEVVVTQVPPDGVKV